MNLAFDKTNENIVIIKINEERLDRELAVDFRDEMTKITSQGHKNFILDFSDTDFIDSSGLGAIVSALKMVGRDGDVILFGINDNIHKMLTLTRMVKVFKIHQNMDDAKNEFA